MDSVLILTDWDEYKEIDFNELSKIMSKPAWFFYTRAFMDINKIKSTDLNIWTLGYGLS